MDAASKMLKAVSMTRLEWIEEAFSESEMHKALHGKQIFNWMNELHAGETAFNSEFIGKIEQIGDETHVSIFPKFVDLSA